MGTRGEAVKARALTLADVERILIGAWPEPWIGQGRDIVQWQRLARRFAEAMALPDAPAWMKELAMRARR